MPKRFCFIDSKGKNVEVHLTVNNGLISGGDFIIVEDPDGAKKTIDNWKMKTGDTGESIFEIIKETPAKLINTDMIWELLTCCAIPASDSGNLKMEIFQGAKLCELSVPIDKDLVALPQCKDGTAQTFKGKLRFVSI